jgi:hypothetical protein
MALASYANYLATLPIVSTESITIRDSSHGSNFHCPLDEFLVTLKYDEQLYRVLLPAYCSLLEEHARNLIEELLTQKGIAANIFGKAQTTWSADQIAENYVRSKKIETWGIRSFGWGEGLERRGWRASQPG